MTNLISAWLYPTLRGLYCAAGDFYIDPVKPVARALITHGHSDHARPGHSAVLASVETVDIMKVRYGAGSAERFESAAPGAPIDINGVTVRFVPAGHILGSCQIVLDHQGRRAVVSGDYKRAADPTCAPFEPVRCDVFITEATFGLPVFRHEPADAEARRLLVSMANQPERAHLLGVYGLGKCQRMIKLVREAGYAETIWLHGALVALTNLYQRTGIDLGDVRPVSSADPAEAKTGLIMCPPSALADRWTRRFTDPVSVFASGWMRVRGRARQRGIELPLVVSDHADWPELLSTIVETEAGEVWVTHGREDALVHKLALMGIAAKALALVGFEDEAE